MSDDLAPLYSHPEERTCGAWKTEEESVAALDECLERFGLFNTYREVPGFYVQPKLDQDRPTARIDRILSPKPELIASGWTHGPVGIECKKSGVKIGPPLAQLLDYSRAVWTLPNGFSMWLSWVFLWPLEQPVLTVASIMAQHRIGAARRDYYGNLVLSNGGVNLLRATRGGTFHLGPGRNGLRAGSR